MLLKAISGQSVGQTITEYVLIGSLVLIISLGSLVMLGKNVSSGFQALLPDFMGAPAAQDNVAANPEQGGVAATEGTTGSQLSDAANDPTKTCVSDGWCLSLNTVKTAEEIATQTTGSNGMELINGYTDVLSQIGAALEEMPDVDPTLREHIINSANAGHDIAVADAQTGTIKDESIAFIYRSQDLRNYLADHPAELPTEVNQVIKKSLDNIQKVSVAKMKTVQSNYYDFYQIPPELQIEPDDEYDLGDFSESVRKNSNAVCKAGKVSKHCVQ